MFGIADATLPASKPARQSSTAPSRLAVTHSLMKIFTGKTGFAEPGTLFFRKSCAEWDFFSKERVKRPSENWRKIEVFTLSAVATRLGEP